MGYSLALLLMCWFGSSILGIVIIIAPAQKQFDDNFKKEPWQMLGNLLVLILSGMFTLYAAIALTFLIPAMNRANERSKQMAKEHARKLREAEGWVQLELFPED